MDTIPSGVLRTLAVIVRYGYAYLKLRMSHVEICHFHWKVQDKLAVSFHRKVQNKSAVTFHRKVRNKLAVSFHWKVQNKTSSQFSLEGAE